MQKQQQRHKGMLWMLAFEPWSSVIDSRHVGEFNFEVIFPTLNKLGDVSQAVGTWESFVAKNEDDEYGAKIILPIPFPSIIEPSAKKKILRRRNNF